VGRPGKARGGRAAAGLDLPDLVDFLLATGLRIGEATAVTWPAVDLAAGTVEVRGTVGRIIGEGLVIKPKPKSKAGWRVVELPTWAVDMLRRRLTELPGNDVDVVFPSPFGRLRDPSNAQNRLREVLADLGYQGITSHAFRRTVATLMDLAGLTARAAADQLGHAKVSMTTDVYFGRRVASTGAAAVLEAVGRRHVVEDENDG
jgi:integrase